MDKKTAIKIIENEVKIILNEYKVNHIVGLDNDDIVIACTNKDNTQFVYANLKSRYDNKKYWDFNSNIIIKHDYIVRITLN
jgi:hypothetical protein